MHSYKCGHNVTYSFTLAESSSGVKPLGFITFRIVFLFFLDWDRPFRAQNEKKICSAILVLKSDGHVALPSDKICFGVDNTSFPKAMQIMVENKTELSDFKWGFAT